MAFGIILSTADINNAIGGTARDLNVLMAQRIPQIYAELQSIGAAGLQAAPLSFSSGDAAVIMSIATDWNNFAGIYTGAKLVATGGVVSNGAGYDFRTFAKQSWGLGY